MMPLSGAAVQTPPHIDRRGTVGGLGTALMSVLLTYQFNHSEIIATAKKVALTPESGAGGGRRLTFLATAPNQLRGPMLHDLSYAYAVVFVIATALVVSTLIPAAFLPKQQASHRRHCCYPHDVCFTSALTASSSHSVEKPYQRPGRQPRHPPDLPGIAQRRHPARQLGSGGLASTSSESEPPSSRAHHAAPARPPSPSFHPLFAPGPLVTITGAPELLVCRGPVIN